jgi:hypothetical protein
MNTRSRSVVGFLVLLLVCLSLVMPLTPGGALPAVAQEAIPPGAESLDPSGPGGREIAAPPAPGAQLDAGGRWYMTAGEESASAGGPDDYGYTWNDAVALSWIDASGGTNTGLTGDSWDQATGLISLPFTFKYYENSYTGLYIAAAGYVAFTQVDFWDDQEPIPLPLAPNNVIAPFWTPTYIGSGAWVRYRAGGTAPSRYFVVEWHDVTGAEPGNTVGENEKYRFEVVLHENGDILFQYQAMTFSGSWYCGAAGIEDSEGLDGLSSVGYCTVQPPSNKAVRYYRPGPSARVLVRPTHSGSFGRAGELVSYPLRMRNTGDYGADTYYLTVASPWTASLYASDGVTPLTDTDGDGVADTGSVPPGGSASFVVKVQAPAGAVAGNANSAVVTARSSLNTGIQRTATAQTAVPARFAQVYRDDADGAQSFYLVQPAGQRTTRVTPDWDYGYDLAVTQLPNGGFFYAWDKYRSLGSVSVYELEYVLLNWAGDVVREVSKLTDLGGATMRTYDYDPAVAATPDGRIGVLWDRRIYRSSDGKYNYNLYFATLDSAGNILLPPTNLTNNTGFTGGSSSELNIPRYYEPTIAATTDNRFVVTWRRQLYNSSGSLDDVYYAVRDSAGGAVRGVTKLTSDSAGNSDAHYYPNAAALQGGRVLVSWSRGGTYGDIYYAVLDSAGNVVKSMTALTTDGTGQWDWLPDAATLSDARTVVAWMSGNWPSYQLRYAVLDAGYNRFSGPTTLANPAAKSDQGYVSVAPAGQQAVLTWMGASFQQHLFYALVSSGGAVVTPPQIFRSSQDDDPSIETGYTGFGNTSNIQVIFTISGRVADGGNQPIAGATVSAGGGRTAITGADGAYTIQDLPAGAYTVTPSKGSYAFSPASRSVTVGPDATGVDFTGTLPDLSVEHIAVNQGVQDRTNGAASVAHKPTLVRAYVDIGPHPGPVNGVAGRLTVKQGATVIATVTSQQSIAASANPSPEELADTLNFSLDGSYLTGELDLEVTVNPDHSVTESSYGNNTQTLHRNFQPRRTVRIGYVPIRYAPSGYAGPQDPGERIAQGDQFMRWIYPLGWNEIEYFPMEPITWTLNVNTGSNASSLLNELGDRLNDCDCDYIYGWLPASAFSGNGLGQRPGRVAFGNDTDGRWRRTFAHELGHNLGALHTQGQTGGDPSAPDTLAQDMDYGINLTTGELKYRRPDNGLLRDVMYAGELEANAWVTPYFWNRAFQALPPPTVSAIAAAEAEHLLVSGVVTQAGGGSLRPLFRVMRPPVPAPQGSDYCLRQENVGGDLLAPAKCFDVVFVGDEPTPPGEMPFDVIVPWLDGAARVRLMQGDVELDRREVSENPPTVTVTVAGATAAWTGEDLDDDTLTYLALYSPDNGATWQPLTGQTTATSLALDLAHLPGGASCLVRVRVTDGVNTSYDDSDPFEVGRKAPQAVIYAPEGGAGFLPGAAIQLLGRGFDPEDGTLAGARLRWSSDQDGDLATGGQALMHLSPGRHVITLTVTDSDGNPATRSVEVYGGARVYLPLTLR